MMQVRSPEQTGGRQRPTTGAGPRAGMSADVRAGWSAVSVDTAGKTVVSVKPRTSGDSRASCWSGLRLAVSGVGLAVAGILLGVAVPERGPVARMAGSGASPASAATKSAPKTAAGTPGKNVPVASAFSPATIEKPAGMGEQPKLLARPGTRFEWKAVLVSDNVLPSADAAGKKPLATEPPAAFGEPYNVVADARKADGTGRLLLARFNRDREFERWFGWVDADEILDRNGPITVREIREELAARMAETDERRRRMEEELPVAERKEYQNVTLKAVTHPERGRYCFLKPVAQEEEEAAVAAGGGIPLQAFAFFYVYKAVPRPGGIYVLLSAKPALDMTTKAAAADIRAQMLGWIELRNLTLWATREAFEYNLSEEARVDRQRRERPIELYRTRRDLLAAAKADNRPRKDIPKPPAVFTEDFKAPYLQKPWSPQVMRYPILDRYPLPGRPDGQGREPAGYQICVLGSTGAGGALDVDPRDFDRYKSMVNDAVKNLRVLEIAFVVDTRSRMSAAMPTIRKALKELVTEIRSREASPSIPETERLYIRVALVGYTDHAELAPGTGIDEVTTDAGKFFDIAGDVGYRELQDAIDKLKAAGGVDAWAQPFEGMRTASRKFLSDRAGSQHTRGAARAMVLFGGAPNRTKEAGPPTRLDNADAAGYLGMSLDQGDNARAQMSLHAVRFTDRPGEDPLWKSQFEELCKRSEGSLSDAVLTDEKAKSEVIAALKKGFAKLVDQRRETLREEIDGVRRLFSRGGASDGAPVTRFAADRLKEVIPESEIGKARTALSRFFFTNVHARERVDGDPEEHPRLRLSVLLTLQELMGIWTACDKLARELAVQLESPRDAQTAEEEARIFKQLLVQAMLTVMGRQREFAPSQVAALAEKPLEEIQDQIARLPIVFGCLKGSGPKTVEQVRALKELLAARAARLLEIIGNEKERLFDPAVGHGERHIWLRPDELP